MVVVRKKSGERKNISQTTAKEHQPCPFSGKERERADDWEEEEGQNMS